MFVCVFVRRCLQSARLCLLVLGNDVVSLCSSSVFAFASCCSRVLMFVIPCLLLELGLCVLVCVWCVFARMCSCLIVFVRMCSQLLAVVRVCLCLFVFVCIRFM